MSLEHFFFSLVPLVKKVFKARERIQEVKFAHKNNLSYFLVRQIIFLPLFSTDFLGRKRGFVKEKTFFNETSRPVEEFVKVLKYFPTVPVRTVKSSDHYIASPNSEQAFLEQFLPPPDSALSTFQIRLWKAVSRESSDKQDLKFVTKSTVVEEDLSQVFRVEGNTRWMI